MLDLMRRHSRSFLIYLIFGVIIIVFAISFGPGTGSGCAPSSANWAARVNGEDIPQQTFALSYNRQFELMRRNAQRTGTPFTAQTAERFGLQKQVIDQLVEQRLLAQEAESRGIVISDKEVLEFLQQQYGVQDVDYDQYVAWVQRTFGTSVSRFENDARAQMKGQRLAQLITDNVEVGESELREAYEREHDKAMLTFVRLDPADHAGTEPNETQIQKFLSDRTDDIQATYDDDPFRYRVPEQVRVRQILRTVPAAATADDPALQEAKALLLELREKIAAGADFAELAQKHSQDTATANKGGDLGLIRRGQMVRAVEQAAFELEADGITKEPVRSRRGLHLIQVLEKVPARRKELDEVKNEIAAAMLKDEAADTRAKTAATTLHAKLMAGRRFAALTAEESGPQAGNMQGKKPVRRDTPWFKRGQTGIPRIGMSAELHDAVFALGADKKDQAVPGVHKVGRSYVVAVLKDRELPDMSKFESEKEAESSRALWSKRSQVFSQWLDRVRDDADIQLNPAFFADPS